MKATHIKLAVLTAVISISLSSANALADTNITGNIDINNASIKNVQIADVYTIGDRLDWSGKVFSGLKEGREGTDAANVDQMNRTAQNAANQAEQNANNYTDNRFDQLSHMMNQRFKQLDDKINRAEKRLNAGIAGVTAIASIPYVAENSFSYGIGLGNYQNGNAVAAGVQYKTSPNTNVRLNVSWDSSSNTALGVGLAGGW
ncbi:hypothetical protein DUU00_22825 [Salmonella enterica subsp. enterica serovar Ohio]|nr:hypothetical protein [Salmonella enterica subsp. enterica serovar Ohio]